MGHIDTALNCPIQQLDELGLLGHNVCRQLTRELAVDDFQAVGQAKIDTRGSYDLVSDLVNVSLVRVQATAVGVYEVTQKKDTLLLQVETLDVAMIRGLLIAFNGRVTAGAGTKPYLSVTLQPDEKPLELLQSILKAMADILAAPPEENTGKK